MFGNIIHFLFMIYYIATDEIDSLLSKNEEHHAMIRTKNEFLLQCDGVSSSSYFPYELVIGLCDNVTFLF